MSTFASFHLPAATTPPGEFHTRASNCALLTISVICICVLVVCGVMIVREYTLGKSYEMSTCKVVSISYTKTINCMFCGTGPKNKKKEKGAGICLPSQFPCLVVSVSFMANGKHYTGILHTDSLQAVGAFAQVSSFVWITTHTLL